MAGPATYTARVAPLEDSFGDSPLERYLKVLESIAFSGTALNASEIATACGLPVGSAHRLVRNLVDAGALDGVNGSRKDYQLGDRLFRLLHAGSDAEKLAAALQSQLDALANVLSGTCYVARLVGSDIASVAWAVPSQGLSGYVIPGSRMPVHAAASAKAILAFQSRSVIDVALSHPLEELTDRTLVDRDAIDAEYARIRKQRYATCWDEMELGLGAIAVPVELPEGGVLYSVTTTGFTGRLQRLRESEVVETLNRASVDIGRAITASVCGAPNL